MSELVFIGVLILCAIAMIVRGYSIEVSIRKQVRHAERVKRKLAQCEINCKTVADCKRGCYD